jgi:hypothetical protein
MTEGDASTSFFHHHDWNTLLNEGSKAAAIHSFFDEILGTPPTWSNGLNLHGLDLP